jgi:tetratricopeptide (TPR) repeat protein
VAVDIDDGDRVEISGGQGVQVGENNLQINQYITSLDTDATQPVFPAMLPRDPPGFTGRTDELERITSLRSDSAVVCTIDGAPGVGKTALAVYAAHVMSPGFPDGQLYADLHGYTEGEPPAEPTEVLAMFLRGLGVSAQSMPPGLEERAAELRQRLAGKRVLVVLDNVSREAQVRPLLPGSGSSLVLLTSRGTLTGLEVNEHIGLDVLPKEDATALLARLAGQERADAEADAVAQVTDFCGCLPLALRIAGQLLAAHLTWTVAYLAGMLSEERSRLDRLAAGDLEVRAAFRVSYRHLATEDARMFRLLSLHPRSDFTTISAGSAAGMDQAAAVPVLERLALFHLITEVGPIRFEMHDLLRLFARETCEAEDEPEARREVQVRITEYYAGLAVFGDGCINPQNRPLAEQGAAQAGMQLATPSQALAMFEAERYNMLAAVELAESLDEPETLLQFGEYIDHAFRLLSRYGDLLSVGQTALRLARLHSNRAMETWALVECGIAYRNLGKSEEAVSCYEEVLPIWRELEDRVGEARSLTALSAALGTLQRHEDAIEASEQALTIFRDMGDRRGEGQALGNLATTYRILRRLDQAAILQRDAARLLREAGDRGGEASALVNLGLTYQDMQQPEEVARLLHEGLEIFREIGDRGNEAATLITIGELFHKQGSHRRAIQSLKNALAILRIVDNPYHKGVTLLLLASAYQEIRSLGNARDFSLQARDIFQEIGYRRGEGQALTTLGITYQKLQLYDEAITQSENAVTINRDIGNKQYEAMALCNLAIIYLNLGRPDRAGEYKAAAQEIWPPLTGENN